MEAELLTVLEPQKGLARAKARRTTAPMNSERERRDAASSDAWEAGRAV